MPPERMNSKTKKLNVYGSKEIHGSTIGSGCLAGIRFVGFGSGRQYTRAPRQHTSANGRHGADDADGQFGDKSCRPLWPDATVGRQADDKLDCWNKSVLGKKLTLPAVVDTLR